MRRFRVPLFMLLAVLFVAASPAEAKRKRGIVGKPAPALAVKKWFNLPAGKKAIDLPELRGQVVYLLFFQSWCPACHSSGLPRLKKLVKEFRGEKVTFLAVQTVFEGYSVNTPAKAKSTAREFGLRIPFGHDGGPERSQVMRKYRTGGTPWIVVIDKRGVVRFNNFFLKLPAARRMIRHLLRE